MFRIGRDNYFRSVVILIAAAASGGCSRPGGFYVVPEHLDLGVISEDRRVAVAEFKIVNDSDRPVEIKHLFPSCQCTLVKLTKNPVLPGKSTILRATADLSQRAGKQDFSVMFITDSPEFPRKRVSFTALVPATGTRQRRISIGYFYPGAEVRSELPASSFARGSVKPAEEPGENDNSSLATHLTINPAGDTVLVVSGTAPHAVGAFSKTLRFRETILGQPSLGKGIVELELAGDVVARWVVKPELYIGFISLSKDGATFSLSIETNPASVEEEKEVSSASATLGEAWLSLESQSVSSNRIKLNFRIHEDKLKGLGAIRATMELLIKYADGNSESYSTNLFAHIDH